MHLIELAWAVQDDRERAIRDRERALHGASRSGWWATRRHSRRVPAADAVDQAEPVSTTPAAPRLARLARG